MKRYLYEGTLYWGDPYETGKTVNYMFLFEKDDFHSNLEHIADRNDCRLIDFKEYYRQIQWAKRSE